MRRSKSFLRFVLEHLIFAKLEIVTAGMGEHRQGRIRKRTSLKRESVLYILAGSVDH